MIPDRLSTVLGAPTVWFTGLSGAGKTTIARELAHHLTEFGYAHVLLDGDELRETISADLGFSREDRSEQVRRVGYLARILVDAGIIPIVALVSPFREDRDRVRELHGPGTFIEVYVDTPVEICERRDVKGLYSRARAGTITQMTGIGQEYEAPISADITLRAHGSASPQVLAAEVAALVRASISGQ
jgi:adenylyl-sulfate kinase